MLTAITPIDGRYARATEALRSYFSEYALIRYRVRVEVEYFIMLCEMPLPPLRDIREEQLQLLMQRAVLNFTTEDAGRVKEIEAVTRHDVKAVEYFLKEVMEGLGLGKYKEFIHFGLTSQDINNTAFPLMLRDALEEVFYPALSKVILQIERLAKAWEDVPMLARTHGQPASPTRLGKELTVFAERLKGQWRLLKDIPHRAKFGGAVGNLNAHYVAYPDVDWQAFAKRFVEERLGLERSFPTTQIEPYDHLAAQMHGLMRLASIFTDLCRDIWTYISMEYFRQKVTAGEVGSSAMPHKVNPIDFENAEGNLGMMQAVAGHLAAKLPISRLQRDLTDSTVLRNLGLPLGYFSIALSSLQRGLNKIELNREALERDLDQNWMVLAEPIQTILRREGFEQPYEKLKAFTRGKSHFTQEDIHRFIEDLDIPQKLKEELKQLSPHTYTGK